MELTTAPARASSSLRLWFAFLGGMVAYALHLLIGFWVVPVACGSGVEGVIPWVEAAVTVLFAAVAVVATVVAVGIRRSVAAQRRSEPARDAAVPAAWDTAPGSSTAYFMATAGVLLNALALAVILVAALPLLLVSPCA